MTDETRHGWLLRGSADAYSAAPYVDFSTWDGVVPRIPFRREGAERL